MSDLAKPIAVKEAIRIAKDYVRDVFADEKLSDLGLEEVYADPHSGTWSVTLGFSRPWNRPTGIMDSLQDRVNNRSYKILTITPDGKVLSVKDYRL